MDLPENSYLPCRLGMGMYSVSIHYRLTRRVACVRATVGVHSKYGAATGHLPGISGMIIKYP